MRWPLLYLCAGLIIALCIDRKRPSATLGLRLGSIVLCTLLWPLWTPVALFPENPNNAHIQGKSFSLRYLNVQRMFDEARDLVVGTSLASLLPTSLVTNVLSSIERIEQQSDTLSTLLNATSDPTLAAGSSEPAWRKGGLRRLQVLLERNQRRLTELTSLAEALRLQLALAKYSDESTEEIRDLVSELGTQVESLDEWVNLSPEMSTPADV